MREEMENEALDAGELIEQRFLGLEPIATLPNGDPYYYGEEVDSVIKKWSDDPSLYSDAQVGQMVPGSKSGKDKKHRLNLD